MYIKTSQIFIQRVKGIYKTKQHLLGLLFFVVSLNNIAAQNPVIIGFGWDYPHVNQLSKELSIMQNTPFDGICFSLQKDIMESFDTLVQKENYFEYTKLSTLKWGKYNHNYILLRGMSKAGGSWFDDRAWISISKNMTGLSKAIKTGKLEGILFDPEYYYEDTLLNPWTYSKAQYPNLTYSAVYDKVKQRGIQFITALQKYTNGFSFLSVWLSSLVIEDLRLKPLEGTRHALLVPFMEGVLLGKNKNVKLIDGNEYAYGYSLPSQFLGSTDYLKKNTISLMRSANAKKLVTEIKIAQPVYYDGILARHASLERGIAVPDKWKWLEENLKYAITTSNSNVVWFYYEKVNWWKDKVNDTLIDILNSSKIGYISSSVKEIPRLKKTIQAKCYNINTGNGYYYFTDPKIPMKTGDIAFKYGWNAKTKNLSLKFIDKVPVTVSIFVNNTLDTIVKPSQLENSIPLKNYVLGKRLAIVAKYIDTYESSGLQGY